MFFPYNIPRGLRKKTCHLFRRINGFVVSVANDIILLLKTSCNLHQNTCVYLIAGCVQYLRHFMNNIFCVFFEYVHCQKLNLKKQLFKTCLSLLETMKCIYWKERCKVWQSHVEFTLPFGVVQRFVWGFKKSKQSKILFWQLLAFLWRPIEMT